MSAVLATLQLAALTWLLATAATSAGLSAASGRVLDGLRDVPPAIAATRIRWLLAAPGIVGCLLTIVVFLPSVFASLLDEAHHCMDHGGHAHLCLVHLPEGGASPIGWGLLIVAACSVVARLAPLVAGVVRGSRVVGSLARFATLDVRTAPLATAEPICAAVGWWAPTVVVSEGFVRGVGRDAADAAIAHERAHVRRRDALWTLVARIASVAHPPHAARRMLSALELATERACDESAAVDVGDRLLVADAILRSQRLGLRQPGIFAASFGPAQWSARVASLLLPACSRPVGLARWDRSAGLAAAATLALASPLHHAAETALSLITH